MKRFQPLALVLLSFSAAALPCFATATYTTIATITCFYGGCSPGVPSTGLVEVQPGLFFGSFQGGILYTVSSTGAISVLSSLPGANAYSTQTPLQASDGYLYIPDYSVFKYALNGTLEPLAVPVGNVGAAALTEDLNQVIYGSSAPANEASTIFSLSLTGTSKVLATAPESLNAVQVLLQAQDGKLYGLTENFAGNGSNSNLIQVNPGSVSDIASFPGQTPSLISASDGNFYGCGGNSLYRLSLSGVYTVIYTFTGGADGGSVYGCPIQGSDGYLYGTTFSGGAYGYGTIYRASLSGSLQTVYSFTGSDNQQQSSQFYAKLTQGSDGKLYGFTSGPYINSPGQYVGSTIFSLDLGLPAPKPAIVLASPARGATGSVLIAGRNVLGALAVEFNGVSSPYTVESARYIQAQPPAGFTSGVVSVTTPNGKASGLFKAAGQ